MTRLAVPKLQSIQPELGFFCMEAAQGRFWPLWIPLSGGNGPPFSLSPCETLERLCHPRSPGMEGGLSFLLDSAGGPRPLARFSFVGVEPYALVEFRRGKGCLLLPATGNPTHHRTRDPLAFLQECCVIPGAVQPPELPPLTGGAVGFLTYECAWAFESLPSPPPDDLNIPDAVFLLVNTLVAFDHHHDTAWAITNPWLDSPPPSRAPGHNEIVERHEMGVERLARLMERFERLRIRGCHESRPHGPHNPSVRMRPGMDENTYCRMVARAKEYIAVGDIYQANLSHRFTAHVSGLDPWGFYRSLRAVNPSPFSGFLEIPPSGAGPVSARNGAGKPHLCLVSASPERLLRVQGEWADTRPIAGTRPRGKTPDADARLREELRNHPKERAEHLMLVDLARNDLGRVCRYGSVSVTEFMITEAYSHVRHLVSNVWGRLHPGLTGLEALGALFPGGTITGVPKIRCMQIIAGLEPVARGPYTGSLGYVSATGDLDFNLLIRTAVIQDPVLHVQVGAGIVADSDPRREYSETLHKAAALLEALNMVKR